MEADFSSIHMGRLGLDYFVLFSYQLQLSVGQYPRFCCSLVDGTRYEVTIVTLFIACTHPAVGYRFEA